MQLMLKGGSTGTHTLTPTPMYLPVVQPVLALGALEAGGQVEIPAGLSVDIRAMLAYRYFSTDDSQSPQAWIDLDTAVAGPGKGFKKGALAAVAGLRLQLGLKLYTSTGTQVGRANLRYPVVVTT